MRNPKLLGKETDQGGLYTGFDSYRIHGKAEIEEALRAGIVSVNTNVLSNLYRYNEATVDDLLEVLGAVTNRLFLPHQVIREFWRNRQSVISGLGGTSKEARNALSKN